MTKYNKYAKRLQAEFLKSREEYKAAVNALEEAKRAKAAAAVFTEKYNGEKAAKQAKAEAAYMEAKANFDFVSGSVWERYKREKEVIGKEFAEAVKADTQLNPEDIDGNAVKLLESGVMTARDYADFADKYKDNSAMLSLISKHASDVAANARLDYEARKPFQQIAQTAKEKAGQDNIVQAWERLTRTCDTLSGQSHGRGEAGYTMSINSQFEELAGAMIEDF